MYEVCENKLVGEWSHLVYKVIRSYGYRYADDDDLFQIGALGLLKANRTYDKSKGYLFKTYAFHCVNMELIREFQQTRKLGNKIHTFKSTCSTDEYINSDVEGMTIGESIQAEDVQYFGVTLKLLEQLITESGWTLRDKELAIAFFVHNLHTNEVAECVGVSRQRAYFKRDQLRDKLRRLIKDERFV